MQENGMAHGENFSVLTQTKGTRQIADITRDEDF
jgi:hypothetical protein